MAVAVGGLLVFFDSPCTDDVLHPWQLFDATYVHQSQRIASFDCVLL